MNVKQMKPSDSVNNNNNENNKNKEDRKNVWLKGINMCEWCGRNRATVNLELKYGSHRECRYCWDRS